MSKPNPEVEAVAEALYELDKKIERDLDINYVTYGAEGMRGINRYRMQAETAIKTLDEARSGPDE